MTLQVSTVGFILVAHISKFVFFKEISLLFEGENPWCLLFQYPHFENFIGLISVLHAWHSHIVSLCLHFRHSGFITFHHKITTCVGLEMSNKHTRTHTQTQTTMFHKISPISFQSLQWWAIGSIPIANSQDTFSFNSLFSGSRQRSWLISLGLLEEMEAIQVGVACVFPLGRGSVVYEENGMKGV